MYRDVDVQTGACENVASSCRLLESINGYTGHEILSQLNGVEPREYQTRCIDNTIQAMRDGERATRWVLGTGGGKTTIAMSLIQQAKRVLYICPSNFAVKNAQGELEKRGIGKSSKRLKGRRSVTGFDGDTEIVFATVQMLNESDKFRLLDPDHFDLIVVDEAHGFMGKQFREVPQHFNGFQVWMTATEENTQWSLDMFVGHKAIDYSYHQLAKNEGYPEMIVVPYHVETKDLHKASYVGGRFVAGNRSEEKVYNLPHRFAVCEKILLESLAKGQKSIGFLPSVSSSKKFVRYFSETYPQYAHLIAHIDGYMSDKEKERIFADLKSGKLLAVFNKDLLNESVSIDDIEHIILADVCGSPGRTFQRIGRGCRKGKERFFVHDVVSVVKNMDSDDFATMESTPKSVSGMMGFKRIPKKGGFVAAGKNRGMAVDHDAEGDITYVNNSVIDSCEVHFTEAIMDLKAMKSRKVALQVFESFAKAFSTNIFALVAYPESYMGIEASPVTIELSTGRKFEITFKDAIGAAKMYGVYPYLKDYAYAQVALLVGEVKGKVNDAVSDAPIEEGTKEIPSHPFSRHRVDSMIAMGNCGHQVFRDLLKGFTRPGVYRGKVSVSIKLEDKMEMDQIAEIFDINGFHVFGVEPYDRDSIVVGVDATKTMERWERYADVADKFKKTLMVSESVIGIRRYSLKWSAKVGKEDRHYTKFSERLGESYNRAIYAKVERAKRRGEDYVVFSPEEVERDGEFIKRFVLDLMIPDLEFNEDTRCFVDVWMDSYGAWHVPIHDLELMVLPCTSFKDKETGVLPDDLVSLVNKVSFDDPMNKFLWDFICSCVEEGLASYGRGYSFEVMASDELEKFEMGMEFQANFVSAVEGFYEAARKKGIIISRGYSRFHIDLAPMFGEEPEVPDTPFYTGDVDLKKLLFSQQFDLDWTDPDSDVDAHFAMELWNTIKMYFTKNPFKDEFFLSASEVDRLNKKAWIDSASTTAIPFRELPDAIDRFVAAVRAHGIMLYVHKNRTNSCQFKLASFYEKREEVVSFAQDAMLMRSARHINLLGQDDSGIKVSKKYFKCGRGYLSSLSFGKMSARSVVGAKDIFDSDQHATLLKNMMRMYGVVLEAEGHRSDMVVKKEDYSGMIPMAAPVKVPRGVYIRNVKNYIEVAGVKQRVPYMGEKSNQRLLRGVYYALKAGEDIVELPFAYSKAHDAYDSVKSLRAYLMAHGFGPNILAPIGVKPDTVSLSLQGLSLTPFEEDTLLPSIFEEDVRDFNGFMYGVDDVAQKTAFEVAEVAVSTSVEKLLPCHYPKAFLDTVDFWNEFCKKDGAPKLVARGKFERFVAEIEDDPVAKEFFRFAPFVMAMTDEQCKGDWIANAEGLMDRRHDVLDKGFFDYTSVCNFFSVVTEKHRKKRRDKRWYDNSYVFKLLTHRLGSRPEADLNVVIQEDYDKAVVDILAEWNEWAPPGYEVLEGEALDHLGLHRVLAERLQWGVFARAGKQANMSFQGITGNQYHRKMARAALAKSPQSKSVRRLNVGFWDFDSESIPGVATSALDVSDLSFDDYKKLVKAALDTIVPKDFLKNGIPPSNQLNERRLYKFEIKHMLLCLLAVIGSHEGITDIRKVASHVGVQHSIFMAFMEHLPPSVFVREAPRFRDTLEEISKEYPDDLGRILNDEVTIERFQMIEDGLSESVEKDCGKIIDEIINEWNEWAPPGYEVADGKPLDHVRIHSVLAERLFVGVFKRASLNNDDSTHRKIVQRAFANSDRANSIKRLDDVLEWEGTPPGAMTAELKVGDIEYKDYKNAVEAIMHMYAVRSFSLVDLPCNTSEERRVHGIMLKNLVLMVFSVVSGSTDGATIKKMASHLGHHHMLLMALMEVFPPSFIYEHVGGITGSIAYMSDNWNRLDRFTSNPAFKLGLKEVKESLEGEPVQADYDRAMVEMVDEWNDWIRENDLEAYGTISRGFKNLRDDEMQVINQRLRYGVFARVAKGNMIKADRFMRDKKHRDFAKKAIRKIIGRSLNCNVMSFGMVQSPKPHDDWQDIPGLISVDENIPSYIQSVQGAFAWLDHFMFERGKSGVQIKIAQNSAVLEAAISVVGNTDPETLKKFLLSIRGFHILAMGAMIVHPPEDLSMLRLEKSINYVAENIETMLKARNNPDFFEIDRLKIVIAQEVVDEILSQIP